MNVLMAWELGDGLGHTVKLSLVGEQLTRKGHHVGYALRNTQTAQTLEFDPAIEVYAAPAMSILNPEQRAAYDYSDLLLIRGYENSKRLDDRIDAWLRIFDRHKTDLVVADHAPCARLAAHIAGITSHAIGTGFAVPPLTSPLHPFIDPRDSDLPLQARLERRLDEAINGALKRYRKPEVERTVAIFIGGKRFLCTVEEIDGYKGRVDETFYGPLLRVSDGARPHWPDGEGPRVFIYLYQDAPLLPVALASLDRAGIATLVYQGNAASDRKLEATGPNTIISNSPVNLSQLAGCDLVICQGGPSTLIISLLQGIPVLTYPRHVEQLMTCRQLLETGLGGMLTGVVKESQVLQTIESMINDESLRSRAEAFSSRYQSLITEGIAENIATSIIDHA
mgnify:CR=1 FL=1